MILAEGRWRGMHGIGRFSQEILSRLRHCDILSEGPAPLSIRNLLWQSFYLHQHKQKYKIFFNPGFNPILFSPIPFVLTIHDLIHLEFPGHFAHLKKIYYEVFLKPSIKKAFKIITVSEYSKKNILEWINLSEDKIFVVNNGVSSHFSPEGEKHQLGYPYLLHTGNTKEHKNILRMIESFALAKIDSSFRLILTGKKTHEVALIIQKYKIENRIIFSGQLSEFELATYYRGAHAFLFPSLHEGFGIPLLEAMASGIPTLTSNVTALPEVAGNAAIFVDPYDIESMIEGIEQITLNETKRKDLIRKGLDRVKLFSWDKAALKIQQILSICS